MPIKTSERTAPNDTDEKCDHYSKFTGEVMKKWTKVPYQKKGCSEPKAWKTTKQNYTKNGVGVIIAGKENNITMIDIDDYKKGNKKFDEFRKLFYDNTKHDMHKTYTTMTRTGGFHYYFQYDPIFINVAGTSAPIDIRTEGGIIYSAGSYFNHLTPWSKKTEDKVGGYKCLIDVPPLKMPDDLREWLIKNMPELTTKNKNKNKVYKNTTLKEYNNTSFFKYNIPEEELIKTLDKLDPRFFTTYVSPNKKDTEKEESEPSFLMWASAMKTLNRYDLYDKYNLKYRNITGQDKYNNNGNKSVWNSCQVIDGCVDVLFNNSTYEGSKNILDYYKYQPVELNTIKPDEIINKNKLGFDFFNNQDNYLCQSDTGTGKTTSFIHRALKKKDNENILVITSRKTLGQKICEDLSEHFDDVNYYEMYYASRYDPRDMQGFVVQIESIKHFVDVEPEAFENTILFLDEYNSLIEHLHTTPTMNETRAYVFDIFINILNNCKQVIATDADINDTSINFLKENNIMKKFKYVKNEYQHNKNIEAVEINSDEKMFSLMRKTKKWICPCDGYANAIAIKKIFPDAVIITRDTLELPDLENNDRIIFSPKIIYGIDISKYMYSVFCFFHTKSVSPSQMVQMVARARKIQKIYFYFERKKCSKNPITEEQIIFDLEKSQKYGEQYFRHNYFNKYKNAYLKILAKYKYIKKCFQSNTRLHFINILKKRGVNFEDEITTKTRILELGDLKKQAKEEKRENFDIKNYPDENRILKVKEKDAEEYIDFFLNKNRLNQHFNICNYLLLNQADINFECSDFLKVSDFLNNKMTKATTQIKFLNDLKIMSKDFNKFEINPTIGLKEPEKYKELYKVIFSKKSCNADFSNPYQLRLIFASMYKSLFGDVLISTKGTTGKDRNKRIYTFNHEYIKKDINLLKLRNEKYKKNNINYCGDMTEEQKEELKEKKYNKYLKYDFDNIIKVLPQNKKIDVLNNILDIDADDDIDMPQKPVEPVYIPDNFEWRQNEKGVFGYFPKKNK